MADRTVRRPSITCPQCGMTSYHPEDVKLRYCGNCHQFHTMMRPVISEHFEADGWRVVHLPSVKTELTAALPLRGPKNEWDRGYDFGAHEWRRRALALIDEGSIIEPGWPYKQASSNDTTNEGKTT